MGSRACLPCLMKFLRFCMVDMVRCVSADEVGEEEPWRAVEVMF